MLAATGRQTNQRAVGRHVLAIMDTAELHFATHEASKHGFGMGGNGEDIGLFPHPVLAVDAATGGVIGLVDCAVLNRTEGKATDHKQRGADDKQSRRWLHGAEVAGDCLADADMITMVGDRESDIFDRFARRPANTHLPCRSARNRTLAMGGLLSEYRATLPEQARDSIAVPAKGKQPARQATVALHFGAITLNRPVHGQSKDMPKTVPLWVVDVREIDPPESAEPVHWRRLTTHEATSLAQARQIVIWYRMRRTIEQVFRSLKSHGLRIEDSQMEEAGCFTKLAVIAVIAAVSSMRLVLARDGSTGQPVTDAADTADMAALRQINASLEGRTEKLKNPYDDSKLAWHAWIVARPVGWSGYTSRGYKPPGPKTMHHGLPRLNQILLGWRSADRSALARLR
jgi:hypothetical protein